jgi:hypothetical protein
MAHPNAKSFNDWLGFIRPHLAAYERLARGKRKGYVAKLAEKRGLKANTLRRYIAAAQFLEAEGITSLPTGGEGRMPVGSVERIARIGKRDPARVKQLLNELAEGKWTTEQLLRQLKRAPKAVAEPRGETPQALAQRAIADLQQAGIEQAEKGVAAPFPHVMNTRYFDRWMASAFVVVLPQERKAVVMDERLWMVGIASLTVNKREFLRSMVVAITMFDVVLVYAAAWAAEIEELRRMMRHDERARLILKNVF